MKEHSGELLPQRSGRWALDMQKELTSGQSVEVWQFDSQSWAPARIEYLHKVGAYGFVYDTDDRAEVIKPGAFIRYQEPDFDDYFI